jgi:ferredoxin
LVDLTRCIGCLGCQVACKSWNERGVKPTVMSGTFTNPPDLNSECYTNIRFVETTQGTRPVWSFVKAQCLHCQDPACVSVCPVGALNQDGRGPVLRGGALHRLPVLHAGLSLPDPEVRVGEGAAVVQKCSFCPSGSRTG